MQQTQPRVQRQRTLAQDGWRTLCWQPCDDSLPPQSSTAALSFPLALFFLFSSHQEGCEKQWNRCWTTRFVGQSWGGCTSSPQLPTSDFGLMQNRERKISRRLQDRRMIQRENPSDHLRSWRGSAWEQRIETRCIFLTICTRRQDGFHEARCCWSLPYCGGRLCHYRYQNPLCQT